MPPPAGVPEDDEDGTVWDWKVDGSDAAKPVYLGAPETDETNWPNLPQGTEHGSLPGHPGLLPVDEPLCVSMSRPFDCRPITDDRFTFG